MLNNTDSARSGGVIVYESVADLSDLVIFGNVGGAGGGIYVYDSDEVTISRTLISNNEGSDVGGVRIESSMDVTFNQVIVADNEIEYGWAGGIAMDSSSGAFDNVQVVRNSGYGVGGMMGCSASITNSLFADNRGEEYAGGLYNYYASTMSNVIFAGNHATDGGGYSLAGYGVMSNSTFEQNVAQAGDGGAIYTAAFFEILVIRLSQLADRCCRGQGVASSPGGDGDEFPVPRVPA